MPTAAAPRGSLVEYALKDETTFGVLPGGNWQKTLAYSDTLKEENPLSDDPVLGLARANNRDQTDPAADLPRTGGQMIVPLDLNHFWFWLKGALGTPVTTGSADPWTHTFTSGGEVLPHRSIEKKLKSTIFLQHTGVLVDGLSFDTRRAGGNDRATVKFSEFYKELSAGSTGAGTPAAILARDPLPSALPVFKMDGTVVADVISFKADYENKAKINDALGDAEGRIQGHDLDDAASFMATLEMRFRSTTLYAQAKAGTAFAGELLWSKSASRSLSLQFGVSRLVPVGVEVGGPGRLMQTFQIRAQQNATTPMLVAVLKNGHAAADYA
jgi:hypothetical protein